MIEQKIVGKTRRALRLKLVI